MQYKSLYTLCKGPGGYHKQIIVILIIYIYIYIVYSDTSIHIYIVYVHIYKHTHIYIYLTAYNDVFTLYLLLLFPILNRNYAKTEIQMEKEVCK